MNSGLPLTLNLRSDEKTYRHQTIENLTTRSYSRTVKYYLQTVEKNEKPD